MRPIDVDLAELTGGVKNEVHGESVVSREIGELGNRWEGYGEGGVDNLRGG